ncbi:hypothetical protein LJC33_03245 [Eubacteriales bacterium OttesenSCG-928-N13]|nr:hypothetical protein [Eubacteriales bacterium OttesenSCG-928-N13]
MQLTGNSIAIHSGMAANDSPGQLSIMEDAVLVVQLDDRTNLCQHAKSTLPS